MVKIIDLSDGMENVNQSFGKGTLQSEAMGMNKGFGKRLEKLGAFLERFRGPNLAEALIRERWTSRYTHFDLNMFNTLY